jgi:polysaccharide export outer membrane protein
MRRRDFLKGSGALLGAAGLGGCAALPRSGPMTVAMAGSDDPEAIEGLVAPLTAEIATSLAAEPPPGFPDAFLAAGPIDPTRIGVGDVLDILIWENQGVGVFSAEGGLSTIPAAKVDGRGRIYVPFIGVQRAAGSTLSDLRARLQGALEPLTLSPQVDVRLSSPDSRLVTVQGAVAQPGVYAIDRATARLGAMIAKAGGATDLPERIEVAVRRDGLIGRQVLSDLFDDPRLDIALRSDDQIVLSPIRERFIVLGASSVQAELAFPTRPFDLLSAIGAARGLRDFDADPTGVFVFRYEDRAVADALLPGPEPDGLPNGAGRPIVFRLDLSEPQGLFLARRFQMRDGDAIFVTNAPLTELRKFLQLFNAVVTPVNTIDTAPL